MLIIESSSSIKEQTIILNKKKKRVRIRSNISFLFIFMTKLFVFNILKVMYILVRKNLKIANATE